MKFIKSFIIFKEEFEHFKLSNKLYHYTTLNNFINIINDDTLKISDEHILNNSPFRTLSLTRDNN